MKRYERHKLKEIICNRCGKRIKVNHGIAEEEVFHVEKRWGYFSKRDMKRDCFDLCEKCYDEMVQEFAVPVQTKEETEFFPC